MSGDLIRYLVLAVGGFTLMTCSVFATYAVRAFARTHDRYFAALAATYLGVVGLTSYVIVSIYTHLHYDTITWRAPLASISFVLLLAGLIGIAVEHDQHVRR